MSTATESSIQFTEIRVSPDARCVECGRKLEGDAVVVSVVEAGETIPIDGPCCCESHAESWGKSARIVGAGAPYTGKAVA